MSNEYDKYRGMTHKQIHDIVFEGYVDENPIKRVFDENSDFNDRLVKEVEIFEYLCPNEKEELEKLGFHLTYSYECQGYYERTYKDKAGRMLEVHDGLGGFLDLDGKTIALDYKSDIVGVNETLMLEKLKEALAESDNKLNRSWSMTLRRTPEAFRKLSESLKIVTKFFGSMGDYFRDTEPFDYLMGLSFEIEEFLEEKDEEQIREE